MKQAHDFFFQQTGDSAASSQMALQALSEQPHRRFSYRLVIAPELIGTAFWLDRLGDEAR